VNAKINPALKKAIVDGGLSLFNQGLTVGTWGNLSLRDRETGLIYIKPSGMPYPDITADDIVVMDKNFRVVEGHRKPSIEYHLHISVMNARDDVNAIIHTHPVYSSVFGVLREEIPGISGDLSRSSAIRLSVASTPSPDRPSRAISDCPRQRTGEGFPTTGLCAWAPAGADAIRSSYVVEKTAQIYICPLDRHSESHRRWRHQGDARVRQEFLRGQIAHARHRIRQFALCRQLEVR